MHIDISLSQEKIKDMYRQRLKLGKDKFVEMFQVQPIE